jgi:hypothetical protein
MNYIKFEKNYGRMTELAKNLSQAPGAGLYLDVYHDSPSSEITLL